MRLPKALRPMPLTVMRWSEKRWPVGPLVLWWLAVLAARPRRGRWPRCGKCGRRLGVRFFQTPLGEMRGCPAAQSPFFPWCEDD